MKHRVFVGKDKNIIFVIPNIMYLKDYKAFVFSWLCWFIEITADKVYAGHRAKELKQIRFWKG